jgi:hypothetical protein
MAQLFTPPFQQTLDANAEAISGARLQFYVSGTTTPTKVYADAALTVELASPVVADGAGRFVPIYLDPKVKYRVIVADASGTPIRDVDPIGDTTIADLADGGGLGLVGFVAEGPNAVPRTALEKARETVSIDDYGAVGDGEADDSIPIQNAIDYIQSIGGGRVFIPDRTYKTTVSPRLRSKVSLVGNGPASLIRSNACHGIIIEKSDEIAPRRISNFRCYGNGCEDFSAIYADVAFPDRVQGLVFENFFGDFFGTGIRGRGFWHTDFKSCRFNQLRRGVWLYNRDVKITIDGCSFIRGGAIVNTEDSVGLQIGDEDTSFRPEDVQVDNSIFFGFDIGVRLRQALFGGIVNCDIDACAATGIEIVTADGGFTIDDNWIDVIGTTGNLRGIHCVPLGYNPPPINIAITNNRVNVPATTTSGAEAVGLLVEANQANMLILGNSFPNVNSRSMRVEGQPSARVKRVKIVGNEGAKDGQFFNMDGCWLDKNTFATGMAVSGNVNMTYGANKGLHTTESIVEFIMPAGQTQFTRTWLSMNAADLPFGADQIACWPSVNGMLTQGGVSTSATRTGVSVKVDTALGADSPIRLMTRIF